MLIHLHHFQVSLAISDLALVVGGMTNERYLEVVM